MTGITARVSCPEQADSTVCVSPARPSKPSEWAALQPCLGTFAAASGVCGADAEVESYNSVELTNICLAIASDSS